MRPLVALAIVLGVLAACRGADLPPPPPESAEQETTGTAPLDTSQESKASLDDAEGQLGLLFARQRQLQRFDLRTGAITTILELPSTDVSLSPDGRWFAAVRETALEGSEEGYVAPEVVLGESGGEGEERSLGPGRAVAWSPDGQRLAQVDGQYRGQEVVIAYTVSTADHEGTDAIGERWTLLGWQGDEIVTIGSRSGVVAIDSGGGEARSVDVAPAELWGVSPWEEGVLISVGDTGASLKRPKGSVPLEIAGALGDGAWSWDGRTVAAVALDGAASQLVLIDARDGSVQEVEEGGRAQGNVVWSEDGERFAFVRVHPERRGRLQVVVCQDAGECEPGFTWVRGIRLLGFSS